MNERIKTAFGKVRAGDDIKRKTKIYIAQKTRCYTKRGLSSYRKILSAAAVCLMTLALFVCTGLYFTPTVFIDVDINPSLELGLNRFNKIISVEALNDDGKELMKSLDIKFMGYDDALQSIIENKSVEVLLSENEIMTITVIETDAAQSADILSGAKNCVNGRGNVYCGSASPEEISAARELGLSCGKYRAFLELRELDPDITAETIQGMTMREIRELICSLSGSIDGTENLPVCGGQNTNKHRYRNGKNG